MVIPTILEPFQGAFTQGRCDANNAIIIIEVLHSIFTKDRRLAHKVPCCAIKLDLSKSYDQFSWTSFLEKVLQVFQFPSHFIWMVMKYVQSTTISIQFNDPI